MLFSSNLFLFAFLPAVLLIYYLVPRVLRNPVILIFSLFFYGWGEPAYILLMIADILLNYIGGYIISALKYRGKTAKGALIIFIGLNLLLLAYFKYANFLLGSLIPPVTLPLGISFYIFQAMSYIIDVYRDEVAVQKNPLTFGAYVTLFPQLIAGPIVRYADIAMMLQERKESLSQIASGIRTFIIGLSKKVLLANAAGMLWNLLQSRSGMLTAWVGLFAYTLQIYFDFSGYSDMAIGLGRMFGFEFLVNFNYPYTSKSITDFWSRWHISLSSWFKEYVYIPLGGNRRGTKRQIMNIVIVWLLTGLWHGANWNFVLWGCYFAIVLIIEKFCLKKILSLIPSIFAHIYTLIVIMLGWVLFYFEDMTAMGSFLLRLIRPTTSADSLSLILGYIPLLIVGSIASTAIGKNLYNRIRNTFIGSIGQIVIPALLFILCVASLASQSYNPFIYFRF